MLHCPSAAHGNVLIALTEEWVRRVGSTWLMVHHNVPFQSILKITYLRELLLGSAMNSQHFLKVCVVFLCPCGSVYPPKLAGLPTLPFSEVWRCHASGPRIYILFPYARDKSQARWITYRSRSDQHVPEACCCCWRLPSSLPEMFFFPAHLYIALSGYCSNMKWFRDPFNPCLLVPCRNILQKQYKAICIILGWNGQVSGMERMINP